MKIAIIFSGAYRTFSVCRKNLSLIIDNPDADIYVSVWDKSSYKSPKIGLSITDPVTESMIRRSVGKDATIEIEPDIDLYTNAYNSKMIHRWKSGFELVRASGIKYDYVLLIRPDLYFDPDGPCHFDNISNYKDTIGMAWAQSEPTESLNDVITISSYDIMEKLMDSLKLEDWESSGADWHRWWYSYVKSFGIPVVPAPEFDLCIFCRVWGKSDHSYRDMQLIHEDWRGLIILDMIDKYGRDSQPATCHGLDKLIEAEQKWEEGYFKRYIP